MKGFLALLAQRRRAITRGIERSFPLLLLLLIVACAPVEEQEEPAVQEMTTTEADVEAIKRVLDQKVALITAGDIDGWINILSDDAVLMPPNEPPVTDMEAFRSSTQDFFDQLTVEDLTVSSQEIVVAGDWAFETYSFDWTGTPVAGGESISDTGHGIHIYQRQPDGSWKIARDIWSSDNPPQGSGGDGE